MTTTTMTKSVNRGYLKRMAKAGRLYLKCRFSYTDDYAFDNAINFGKADDFTRVYLLADYDSPKQEELDALYTATHPASPDRDEVERLRELIRRDHQAFRAAEDDAATGCIKIRLWDFRTKSGHCNGTKDAGNFSVHSNLCYRYEVRDA